MVELIDTSVLISIERSGCRPDILGTIYPDETPAIAAISASELLIGIYRAGTAERSHLREEFVEALLREVMVVPFDLPVARTHSQSWAYLMTEGQLIGNHDMLIAATAVSHGYSVLTHNLRDFHRVPGLVVHQPYW